MNDRLALLLSVLVAVFIVSAVCYGSLWFVNPALLSRYNVLLTPWRLVDTCLLALLTFVIAALYSQSRR